jgi:murein DD-endopeptidase MepM/ murein hydrolase activator NlpD
MVVVRPTVKAPTPERRLRGFTRGVFSAAALTCAVALAVGLSIPAQATFGGVTPMIAKSELVDQVALSSAKEAPAGQEAVVGAASDGSGGLDRSSAFSGETYAEGQRALYQAAGKGFAPGFVATTGSVRWPFDHSVPLSSGFGYSDPSYGGFHSGLDFLPGEGSAVGAIADGIVTWVGWDGAYGYDVRIAHNVDGVRIESVYAHMKDDSSELYPGQEISVGTKVGLTGDTGNSTGPHLHLGISINGEYVDPFTWMEAHATDSPDTPVFSEE